MSESRRARASWRLPPAAVWLVLVLIGVGVLTSFLAFQEPAGVRSVRTAECGQVDARGRVVVPARTVALPYAVPWAERQASQKLVCEFTVDMLAAAGGETALYIPSFVDSVAVEVNGQAAFLAERYRMRNLRLATLPAFAPLSNGILREGANRFQLTLSALPARSASLDRLFIGDAQALRTHFHARWFMVAVLPTLALGGAIAFAVVFGVIWVALREREFGWLSATLGLGVLQGSTLIPDFGIGPSDRPIWSMFGFWEVAAALMFCRAVAGLPASRRDLWWALPPALLTLFFVSGLGGGPLHRIGMVLSMAMVFVYMVLALGVLARAAWRGSQDAGIVLLGKAMVFIFIIHDISIILQQNPELIFLTRAVYSSFLLAVAMWMTLRFVRAMREVDNTAETLRERVAATQDELRQTYEELRLRREAEAVDRERARLMRDLHDGLGGELASMLALADSPDPHPQEIASHARAALADMRLIISSLEDYGGDLTLALGTWRERAGPQVKAAGLELVWAVRDVPSLVRLGPAQTLDILRIVQEAVTNVIKHAHATRATIETFEAEEGIGLSICDNGTGGEPQTSGNGLGNMQMRARRLNAKLTISRDNWGTCVRLVLPRELASGP